MAMAYISSYDIPDRDPTGDPTMITKYTVCADGNLLGIYDAKTEQEARDMCAIDAGYESEADMERRLEEPSGLVAALANE